MKTNTKLVALGLAGLMMGSLASCGGGNGGGNQPQGGANELAIYAVNLGDGIVLVESLMEHFKEESWVKEKYPNLTFYFKYNDSEAYSVDLMKAGKGGNPYDLIFGAYMSQFSSPDMVYDLADSFYNATIPGEDVTVSSKLTEMMLMEKAVTNANGGTSYYTVPWSSSIEGMVYNA